MSKYKFEDIERMEGDELEAFIDGLCETLASAKQVSEGNVYLRDHVRLMHVQFAYAALRKIIKGKDVIIKCELHSPIESIGSVKVEGHNIHIEDMKWFCRVAEFSDNTEIYPLANGKTRMTFTFHGLVKRIG